jgi:hypothetical protein
MSTAHPDETKEHMTPNRLWAASLKLRLDLGYGVPNVPILC